MWSSNPKRIESRILERYPFSLQHYAQKLSGESNPIVHRQINGKENVVYAYSIEYYPVLEQK